MKCTCAGRHGYWLVADNNRPTGPSMGIEYVIGTPPEVKCTSCIRSKNSAAGRRIQARTLHVIEALNIGLPDIDFGIRNRTAIGSAHVRANERRFAARPAGHVLTQLETQRIGCVEGSEHCGLGGVRTLRMVERDGQHRKAQHARQQDELLTLVVALLACRSEEVDASHLLGFGQVHFADKVVQVSYQCRKHLLESRVLAPGRTLKHGPGDGVFIDVLHGLVLSSSCAPPCVLVFGSVTTLPDGGRQKRRPKAARPCASGQSF